MAFATASPSAIGANFGNSDGATQMYPLGSTLKGSSNSEWVYVQNSSALALTTGMLVAITSGWAATPCSLGLAVNGPGATNGLRLGFAQGNFAVSDFGWIALRGDGLQVMVSSQSTLGVPLYVGASNQGSITNATAVSATLAGIILTSVSATAVNNPNCTAIVTWPRLASAAFGA